MTATLLGFQRIRTVVVIPETPTGLAEAFAFDIVTDMSQTHPGQVFRHPLQNGQEGITDGVRREPEELSVSGLATDTPIRFFSPRTQGAVALYEQLLAIRAQEVPVTVVTSFTGVGTSRWPETVTGTHGAAQGASIEMSVNFVKLNIVQLLLVPSQVDSDVMLLGAQSVLAWDS